MPGRAGDYHNGTWPGAARVTWVVDANGGGGQKIAGCGAACVATRCLGHGLKGPEFCGTARHGTARAAQVVANAVVAVTGKEVDEIVDGVGNVDISAKVRSSDMRLSLSWRLSAVGLTDIVLFISVSLVVDLNTLHFVMSITRD